LYCASDLILNVGSYLEFKLKQIEEETLICFWEIITRDTILVVLEM